MFQATEKRSQFSVKTGSLRLVASFIAEALAKPQSQLLAVSLVVVAGPLPGTRLPLPLMARLFFFFFFSLFLSGHHELRCYCGGHCHAHSRALAFCLVIQVVVVAA